MVTLVNRWQLCLFPPSFLCVCVCLSLCLSLSLSVSLCLVIVGIFGSDFYLLFFFLSLMQTCTYFINFQAHNHTITHHFTSHRQTLSCPLPLPSLPPSPPSLPLPPSLLWSLVYIASSLFYQITMSLSQPFIMQSFAIPPSSIVYSSFCASLSLSLSHVLYITYLINQSHGH